MEQFTQRVFGLPSKQFFPKHSQILQDMRHLLVPGMLGSHAEKLATKVQQHLPLVLPVGSSKVGCCAVAVDQVVITCDGVVFALAGSALTQHMLGPFEKQATTDCGMSTDRH